MVLMLHSMTSRLKRNLVCLTKVQEKKLLGPQSWDAETSSAVGWGTGNTLSRSRSGNERVVDKLNVSNFIKGSSVLFQDGSCELWLASSLPCNLLTFWEKTKAILSEDFSVGCCCIFVCFSVLLLVLFKTFLTINATRSLLQPRMSWSSWVHNCVQCGREVKVNVVIFLPLLE